MYKNILLTTNFKKSEKLFNFKIIHRINWGSIINHSCFYQVKRGRGI